MSFRKISLATDWRVIQRGETGGREPVRKAVQLWGGVERVESWQGEPDSRLRASTRWASF